LGLKNANPEQVNESTVLNLVIDNKLLAQQAARARLQEKEAVSIALEGAKSKILAQAYKEMGVDKMPGEAEVNAYYTSHPNLFAKRRIYAFQELKFQGAPEDNPQIERAVKSAKSLSDFIKRFAQGSGIAFTTNRMTQAAEGIPLALVDTFAQHADGDLFTITRSSGQVSVIYIEASKSVPVGLDVASPAIGQFLLNSARDAWAKDKLLALRKTADIKMP
jgi:peptidyl-prolyl cis-trans isomerase C